MHSQLQKLASERIRLTDRSQHEADCRNVALRAVFGSSSDEFETVGTLTKRDNKMFWSKILDTIDGVELTTGTSVRPLSHYEKTNILCIRAHQLSANAASAVSGTENALIASEELRQQQLDFQIRRTFLDGHNEYLKVQNLQRAFESKIDRSQLLDI